MRRGVLSAASRIAERCPRPLWRSILITLTYRPGVNWQRYHITEYLKRSRRHLERLGHRFQYVWVMELTRRGVPHYHVLCWLPDGVNLPMPDRSGDWPHGLSRIETAHAPVGYVMKYASKGVDGELRFPRGARIYGAGGLSLEDRAVVRWWMLPKYVREHFPHTERVIRAKGGGWLSLTSGEWIAAATCIAGVWDSG